MYVLPELEIAGVRLTLLNAFVVWNVPDVSVTAASGLKMTVDPPAVNVPDRVKSVPLVPVSVMVEAVVEVPSSVPPVPMTSSPELKL